jgi:hypothetical protein
MWTRCPTPLSQFARAGTSTAAKLAQGIGASVAGEGEARATDGPVGDQDRFAITEPHTNGSASDSGVKRIALPNGSFATEARAGATGKAHAGAFMRTPGRPSPRLGRVNPKLPTDPDRPGADGQDAAVEPVGPQSLATRHDLSIRYPSAGLEPAAALLGWLSIAALGAAELASEDSEPLGIAVVVPWARGVPRRRLRQHPARGPEAQLPRGPSAPLGGPEEASADHLDRLERVLEAFRRVPQGVARADHRFRRREGLRLVRAGGRIGTALKTFGPAMNMISLLKRHGRLNSRGHDRSPTHGLGRDDSETHRWVVLSALLSSSAIG